MRPDRLLAVGLALLLLGACAQKPDSELPGTLEWDRADILAESSEPVVALAVQEGQHVHAGQVLLRLDPRRTQAQLDAARADVRRLAAQLDELRHGARVETIDASRAQLARAQSDAANARKARDRAAALRRAGTIAQAQLDDSETALRMADAAARADRAQLQELLHGTRPEQLEQAEAALAGARAQAARLAVTRARLDVRAPRDGRVDALPYRLGDQPPVGATLASLLVGKAPFARVYVPERQRAATRPGQHFRVRVDGIDRPFDAVVRSVRSDPAFTPYYALSGDDATRLSYRAELVLQGERAQALPAGLPCHAEAADGQR